MNLTSIHFPRRVTEDPRSSWLQTLSSQLINHPPYARYTNGKYPCIIAMQRKASKTSHVTITWHFAVQTAVDLSYVRPLPPTGSDCKHDKSLVELSVFVTVSQETFWPYLKSWIRALHVFWRSTRDCRIRFGMGGTFLKFFGLNMLMSPKWSYM